MVGSLQVVFSQFALVRGLWLVSVIFCSAGVGAFIRELFIIKKEEQADH